MRTFLILTLLIYSSISLACDEGYLKPIINSYSSDVVSPPLFASYNEEYSSMKPLIYPGLSINYEIPHNFNEWSAKKQRRYLEFPSADTTMVPKVLEKPIILMLDKVILAASYKEGINILKSFMINIGLIQKFSKIELIHASSAEPSLILKSGILSAQELKARGIDVRLQGQNFGDGIYTVGTKWSDEYETSSWGKYQYKITDHNVHVLNARNRYASAFIKIYDAIRKKWSLPRFSDTTIMSPGLPESAYSINGHIARLPQVFADLNIYAISSSLEVFIGQRLINPSKIEFLEN